ncbi:MAG: AAA family ATPase [Proteobacteria bacterium]|nr:AAA family ATPase [Pseudomonadota bacterium]
MDLKTIQRLLSPEAFPHAVKKLELLETHISWVILTGDFAYKIKKPLDLGFLDYSTLAQRQHYCSREIELNRRYTPELYLGVVPVTGSKEAPKMDGKGPIVDYAVKMKQFDSDSLLGTLSEKGELTGALVHSIASELAKSHRDFSSVNSATGNPGAMQDAMIQNFDQMREYAIDDDAIAQLDSLEAWTRQQLAKLLPYMSERVEQGHVKDLHGDLHLNNMIVMDGSVRFFDCIEFNENFRLMDTMAEIAFLAMDMADRGERAQKILNDYLEYTGDYAGLQVLDLYRVYFAMVRAKVALMQESNSNKDIQQTPCYQVFTRFLQLGLSFISARPPFLVLMHGVSGSGKSTVAAQVAEHFSAIRLRSDVERKRLFALLPDSSSDSIEEDIYSADASRKTFEHLADASRRVIDSGSPCIVDATFLDSSVRKIFIDLAEELDVPAVILSCSVSEQCLINRLQHRGQNENDASEADIEIMRQQVKQLEPFSTYEQQYLVTIDSEQALDGTLWQQLAQITAAVPNVAAQLEECK